MTKKSLVLIHDSSDSFLGMGFVIASGSEGTYILTASHVLKNEGEAYGNKKIKIEGEDNTEILCEGNIILSDIAVIFIKNLINYPSLKLYSEQKLLPERTKYKLLGYSLHNEETQNAFIKTEVEGFIYEHASLVLTNKKEVSVYEIKTSTTNEIEKGYSGTAIFLNDTDIVIGLLSSKKKNSSLAYVIPIQQLREVWNNKKNWNDESKWREIPSEWFEKDNFWERIKNKKNIELTNISRYSPLYQVQPTLLEKIKSLFIILGISGALVYVAYENLEFFQSEKLNICYEKRDFNVFLPKYIGCEETSKSCKELEKKYFARYTKSASARCFESKPKESLELYTEFAQKYMKNKKYGFAIESYKRVINLDKSVTPKISLLIVKVYEKKLLIDKSLTAQEYSNLGKRYFDTNNSKYDINVLNASESSLDKAQGKFDTQAYSYYNIGLVYERQSNYDEALQNYEKALNSFKKLSNPRKVVLEEYDKRIKFMEKKLRLKIKDDSELN